MKRTISFMNWEGSLGHNTRAFIAANVDADIESLSVFKP